jgi:hypothetical protein
VNSGHFALTEVSEVRIAPVQVEEEVRRLGHMLTRLLLAFFLVLTVLLVILGLLLFLPAD